MAHHYFLLLASAILLFLGAAGDAAAELRSERFLQKVLTEDMGGSLRSELETACHESVAEPDRLFNIKRVLLPTYGTVPQHRGGQLSPRSAHRLLQSYFAKEHGWFIHGLEYTWSGNFTGMQSAAILQQKAPAVSKMLLSGLTSSQGILLDDVVLMVAVLEHFVLGERARFLEKAYKAQRVDTSKRYPEDVFHRILLSYALAFEEPEITEARNYYEVTRMLQHQRDLYIDVTDTWRAFLLSRRSHKPFDSEMFSFEDAMDIAAIFFSSFGKSFSRHCSELKTVLIDNSNTRFHHPGQGRISFQNFYSPSKTSMFRFNEGIDYLRSIGALDGPGSAKPNIIIPNYVQGPSNCLRNSPYFSLCCISECEELMTSIHSRLQKPSAKADDILQAVRQISSDTVESPRSISSVLEDKLRKVASRHGGAVPLHGRLFAQWMHFAYPNECAYPTVLDNASNAQPGMWTATSTYVASHDERKSLTQTTTETHKNERGNVDLSMWSDDEMLLVDPMDSALSAAMMSWARVVFCIAAVGALFSTQWSMARSSIIGFTPNPHQKEEHYML